MVSLYPRSQIGSFLSSHPKNGWGPRGRKAQFLRARALHEDTERLNSRPGSVSALRGRPGLLSGPHERQHMKSGELGHTDNGRDVTNDRVEDRTTLNSQLSGAI